MSDSDRAALREAVRFERYKLATARAQMQKEGRRAEVAPQSAEQPKTAPAKSDNKALQEAVQFERHKIAAARAQERKDTIESASAQPQKPQERRRYSRRSPPATEPRP